MRLAGDVRAEYHKVCLGHSALNFFCNVSSQLRVHHAQLRVCRADAMRQRPARQVVVDKGRSRAEAPERPPEKDKVFAVLEVNRHYILGLNVVRVLQPASIAEHRFVSFGIGPRAAFEPEEGLVGRGRVLGGIFENVKQVESVFSEARLHAVGTNNHSRQHLQVVVQVGFRSKVGRSAESRRGGNGERN